MKTIAEIQDFLNVWKNLTEEDRSIISSFMGGIALSLEDSPKIPKAQNLKSDFLIWFNDDYAPTRFEHIFYTDGAEECVGIIKSHSMRTGEIVLYCSFNYTRKELDTTGTTIITPGYRIRECTETEYKRLKRELGKVGLVWKDKLHRLEPENVKAEMGSSYFYIDDNLKIVGDTEKHGKASHLRYIAGNYFTDYGKALQVCDRIRELLKESMTN